MVPDIDLISAISSFVNDEFDDKIELIRVDAGHELRGIGAIAGYMALSSQNGVAVTSLYDSYKSKV